MPLGSQNKRRSRLTPTDLLAICDTLNDERGTGGQSKPARLLDWNYSMLWRKLNGKSPITQSDELAIRGVLSEARQSNCGSE